MKLLFMGTPEFGATILNRLAQSYPITGVVTQPDRPAGRKNILTPPAVKLAAQALGLPVMQVEKLRSPEIQARLGEFAGGADAFVVASFGMILPEAVLAMPPLQCINVHASLLPLYRGASPVAQAIVDGREETGVTIMLMEKGLDTGPMLSRVAVLIKPGDTQASLMAKLAVAGGELLVATLPRWASGEIEPEAQDHARATHTGIIQKDAGRINWAEPASLIERKSRAYDPWPGVFTFWNGQLLKLGHSAVVLAQEVDYSGPVEPGRVVAARVSGSERLLIGTGQGYLAPHGFQLPGKKMLSAADFGRGYRDFAGSRLA